MIIPQLVKQKRVIVVLGPGGVGKTTCSTALAFAAAKAGKNVALLSIDPAKRLASALGLKFGSQLHLLDLPEGYEGSLSAAMLDQKAIFDEQVFRFVKSKSLRESIMKNKLYQQVATRLGGPLEYIAVAKLEQLLSDARYDLVILDTPPDTHALDFLARPDVLRGFSDNKVMTWLIKPFHLAKRLGMHHMISLGEKLMGGIAKVTGVAALATLAEFLVLMEDVIEGFNQSGRELQKRLSAADAGFVVVSALRQASVRSAQHLWEQLRTTQYEPSLWLSNMTMDPARVKELTDMSPFPYTHPLFAWQRRAVAERDMRRASKDYVAKSPLKAMVEVPEQDEMVLSVAAMSAFAEQLINAKNVMAD